MEVSWVEAIGWTVAWFAFTVLGLWATDKLWARYPRLRRLDDDE